MKKLIKTLSGVLALTLVLSSTSSITVNAAIDPFLLQPQTEYEVDPTGMWADQPITKVEQSNHIPQRVDLTAEQIQGLVASTLMVIPEIAKVYGYNYVAEKGLDALPYQPMYYTSVHSYEEYHKPCFQASMHETVNYLGDYAIGGTLDPTKVVYEAVVSSSYNDVGREVAKQRKQELISYDEWLSKTGTTYNVIDYQDYYRTTYNYAIIVNGQNSPTFNVGTNILAIISPLGDRMYFDVFGLDAQGNVYIPDGYHYYNSLLNVSYQEYKHNLGICMCTEYGITTGDNTRVPAMEQANRQVYDVPADQPVHACAIESLNIRYESSTMEEFDLNKVLQKINGKNYTPVTIK